MTQARLTIQLHGYWHAGSGRGDGGSTDATVIRTRAGLPYLPGRTIKGLLRDAARQVATLPFSKQSLRFKPVKPRFTPAGTPDAWLSELFGSALPPPAAGEQNYAAEQGLHRFDTTPGLLYFGNARLGRTADEQQAWERWAGSADGRERVAHLYRSIASTALASSPTMPASNKDQGAGTADEDSDPGATEDIDLQPVATTAGVPGEGAAGIAKHGTLRAIEVVVPVTLYAFVEGPDESDDWIADLNSDVLPLVRRMGKGRTRGFGACTWRIEALKAEEGRA